MAVLGLRFCARAFSSCGKRGPLFIAVRGPLTVAASPVAEHRLQTRRLSNCGPRSQSLRGMWDPPRPGLKPMSPALAGRPSTTAPPGKPMTLTLLKIASQLFCRIYFNLVLLIRFWLCIFGKKIREVMLCSSFSLCPARSQCPKWSVPLLMIFTLITLINVLLARFLHCKVVILLFIMNRYFVERILETI